MTKSRGLRDNNSRRAAKEAGLLRYRSSTPCKNGHLFERLVSNGSCLECLAAIKSEKDRQYHLRHAERQRQKASEWRRKNPERAKEADKQKWFANHKENLAKCKVRAKRHTEKRRLNREYEHFMSNLEMECEEC